ncbi:MAG: FAD:protein FMN transferase [Pirellulaceae bacterium]|nr:FAD:protein FMN transferase [Pirellulaceae bacterium]
MAVPIRIVLYAPDADSANRAAQAALAEFNRLNLVFSDYDARSEARRLCKPAEIDQPTRVSDDLFLVLAASEEMYRQSGGAFDVTAGPLTKLWRRTLRRGELPTDARLAEARDRVGFDSVRLDPARKTVALGKRSMQLDFGGITKGYALDKSLEVLNKHGITRALIDASGDIRVGDPPPGREAWRVGIARLDDDGPPVHFLALRNAAVANSGDSWQYVEIDGRRYSHLIDPRSGMALTDHAGVTVLAPNAMLADALASAVSVLGPTDGIKLVESHPDAAVLIVRSAAGKREVHRSSRFERFVEEPNPERKRAGP